MHEDRLLVVLGILPTRLAECVKLSLKTCLNVYFVDLRFVYKIFIIVSLFFIPLSGAVRVHTHITEAEECQWDRAGHFHKGGRHFNRRGEIAMVAEVFSRGRRIINSPTGDYLPV